MHIASLVVFAVGTAANWLIWVVRRDCAINERWLNAFRKKLKEEKLNG